MPLDIEFEAHEDDELFADRPKTRGDCVNAVRPCPWAGCRHHLLFDLTKTKREIKLSFGHDDPLKLPNSCSLDLADKGAMTMEETSRALGIVRQGIFFIEETALRKLKNRVGAEARLLLRMLTEV